MYSEKLRTAPSLLTTAETLEEAGCVTRERALSPLQSREACRSMAVINPRLR